MKFQRATAVLAVFGAMCAYCVSADEGEQILDIMRASVQCSSVVRETKRDSAPFTVLSGVRLDKAVVARSDMPAASERWRALYGAYAFHATGLSYSDYCIEARSLCGGRSFTYDPRTKSLRLVFNSKEERKELGSQMIALFDGKLNYAETLGVLLAVSSVNALYATSTIERRRVLATYLGDFAMEDDLLDAVLGIALEDNDDVTREWCLRSLASVAGKLSSETKTKIANKVKQRSQENGIAPLELLILGKIESRMLNEEALTEEMPFISEPKPTSNTR